MSQQSPAAHDTEQRSRHLPLAGSHNTRDVGGYATSEGRTTRWGVLLRSDSLHALPVESQEALLARGLRTVVDLRHPTETEHWPNVFAASAAVQYLNLPLNAAPRTPEARARMTLDLVEMNRRYLDEAQAEIGTVLRALAGAEWPALIQCQAGKDRTGLVLALLLSLAGVAAETIAEDYALSSEFLGEAWMATAREGAARLNIPWEDYQKLLVCPPEFMLSTLEYIGHRYGGVPQYLQTIGLTAAELSALKEALVE